jgi:exosortase/archaeosortase family protein
MKGGRPNTIPLGLLALLCALLMVLPFVTTFDDLLSTLAIRTGIDHLLAVLAPVEARLAVGMLSLLGLPAAAHGSEVVFRQQHYAQPLLISWNCSGWQSLMLLGVTLAAGLRAEQSMTSRLQTAAIGVLGTSLVSIVRIALVCLLAASAGQVPAVIFHDYGGTLLTVGWLFLFWIVSARWLLVPRRALQ